MAKRGPHQRRVRPAKVVSGDLYSYDTVLAAHGLGPLAGTDEAGRGACAGPLVVAAVVLPDGSRRRDRVKGLADSKALTPAVREEVYSEVVAKATAWVAVVVDRVEVDRGGVHRANVCGMRRALARLDVPFQYALTDGFPIKGLHVPSLAVWKGDAVSASIAAASVIAKVTRDRIMRDLDQQFPDYGFAIHKGYITPAHTAAMRAYGPCEEHRQSFANVAALLGRDTSGLTVVEDDAISNEVAAEDVRTPMSA